MTQSNFVKPKSCVGIKDLWHRPYLIWTGMGYIVNTDCALSREAFDTLCIKYKVRNPLPKK